MSNLSLPIIETVYQVYKDIFSLSGQLPKRIRFSLGQSLETSIISFLENLILSKNAAIPIRKTYLYKAQSTLEICQLKLRLLLELKLSNETRIFQIQSKLEEAGRMLGGWIKSV